MKHVNFYMEEEAVVLLITLPIMNVKELPSLMKARKYLTGYELASLYDITVADTFIKELQNMQVVDNKPVIKVTGVKNKELLLACYRMSITQEQYSNLDLYTLEFTVAETLRKIQTLKYVA